MERHISIGIVNGKFPFAEWEVVIHEWETSIREWEFPDARSEDTIPFPFAIGNFPFGEWEFPIREWEVSIR